MQLTLIIQILYVKTGGKIKLLYNVLIMGETEELHTWVPPNSNIMRTNQEFHFLTYLT